MMMSNIVVTLRDRPKLLQTFLQTLSHCEGIDAANLVIVDLGSPREETEAIICKHRRALKVQHEWLPYRSTFHKTKALNHALSFESEYVTIVDVDALFPINFLKSISQFFENDENRAKKLAYRIHYLDEQKTKLIQADPNHFFQKVAPRPELFQHLAHEGYQGIKCGNSHMTIRRETLLKVGGFDERFIGYGLEDHDLNMRLHHAGVETAMNLNCELFHCWHQREADWENDENSKRNRAVFAKNQAAGFRPIPINEDFGKFMPESHPTIG